MASFFDDLARFYDLDHSVITDDMEMYRSFALQIGGPVLELGCGTGRIALPLARDGYDVAAVDFSPAMLNVLRAKLVDEPPDVAARVEIIQADMRRLELDRPFALALCPLNTFMHMTTRADQMAALNAAHRHLLPGGTLVVDVVSAYPMLLAPAGEALTLQRELRDPSTARRVQKFTSMRFDHAKQIQRIVLLYDEIAEDGAMKRATLSVDLRYVFRFEMELLLERAGFSVEGVYGNTDLEPYGMDSERMIFVARR
jgi:ubiquinone/menaquinone biosynthesis C-methylase UbiE